MRRELRSALAIAVVLAAVIVPAAVLAHDGDGRAEVVPARVEVGDSVMVLGGGLTAGSKVDVALVTGGGALPLASGLADAAGDLSIEVDIPNGLEARYYELHATDATGLSLAGYLEVISSGSTDGNGAEAAAGAGPMSLGWVVVAAAAVTLVVVTVLVSLRSRRAGRP